MNYVNKKRGWTGGTVANTTLSGIVSQRLLRLLEIEMSSRAGRVGMHVAARETVLAEWKNSMPKDVVLLQLEWEKMSRLKVFQGAWKSLFKAKADDTKLKVGLLQVQYVPAMEAKGGLSKLSKLLKDVAKKKGFDKWKIRWKYCAVTTLTRLLHCNKPKTKMPSRLTSSLVRNETRRKSARVN